MRAFKGFLETAGGERAPASLTIDETTLSLTAGGDRLGSWGFDAIAIRRSASDRFVLDLADERLIFIALDPVDFAYTVPGWVEAHQPRRRRGIRKGLGQRRSNLIERIEKSGGRRHMRRVARSDGHVHTWSVQNIPGGLIRRVCRECDHVSIDLRDADVPESIVIEPETPFAT